MGRFVLLLFFFLSFVGIIRLEICEDRQSEGNICSLSEWEGSRSVLPRTPML